MEENSGKIKAFNRNDEQFLEAFVIFCGLGIQNTQMYEAVERAMAKQMVTLEVRLNQGSLYVTRSCFFNGTPLLSQTWLHDELRISPFVCCLHLSFYMLPWCSVDYQPLRFMGFSSVCAWVRETDVTGLYCFIEKQHGCRLWDNFFLLAVYCDDFGSVLQTNQLLDQQPDYCRLPQTSSNHIKHERHLVVVF